MEIQPEIIRKLYKVKKIDDLNAASAKIIPPTLHARVQTATKEDNSHQAKVRVRRRCPAGQWIHCKRPTKSSIPKPRHQRRHKRGVTKRDHSWENQEGKKASYVFSNWDHRVPKFYDEHLESYLICMFETKKNLTTCLVPEIADFIERN